jgi:hypothetical protein
MQRLDLISMRQLEASRNGILHTCLYPSARLKVLAFTAAQGRGGLGASLDISHSISFRAYECVQVQHKSGLISARSIPRSARFASAA